MAKKNNSLKKLMNKDIVDYVLWFIIIVLILAIIYVLCLSNESFTQEDDNSIEPTSSDKVTLVMFYAPWCGHCSTTKPELEKAKPELDGKTVNGKKIKVMMIDCDANPEMNKKYDVEGYPTIKLFKQGSQVEYNGDRSKESFVEFVNNNA